MRSDWSIVPIISLVLSFYCRGYNDYEYLVAVAGLSYMGDDDCKGVGYDESGNSLYAAVQPLAGGSFQIGLYSDAQCIVPNTKTDYTYDDFVETDDDSVSEYAEYTLTTLSAVYDDFKFCTSCMDYPTYQDGYFIGDDGTDEDDLINQCWKFYSHDSFNCDADCIAMGAAQGSITWIEYGGQNFGALIDGQYERGHDQAEAAYSAARTTNTSNGHRLERLKANLFMTTAGILFIATFLAFVVARGSSRKQRKRAMASSSRRRRLLDEDHVDSRERRPTTSASVDVASFGSSLPSRSSKSSRWRKSAGKAPSASNTRSQSKSRTASSKGGERLAPNRSSSHRSKSHRSKSSHYQAPCLD